MRFPSLFYFLFCLLFTFFISWLVSVAAREPEKRRLITVSVFRLVFVVVFLHSNGCGCGKSRATLHCFPKLCRTSVWLDTATCRVLSVCQHAVSVCHDSVCSLGPMFLLLVAFVASPIGRILRDWLRRSPRHRTLIEYGCRC